MGVKDGDDDNDSDYTKRGGEAIPRSKTATTKMTKTTTKKT